MKKLLALLLLASIPSWAAYSHSRPIIINHTKVAAALTGFPVTVAGQYPFLATAAVGGGVTNASGYDIIFTSDSACNTPLNFQRVYWNSATGQSEFHVNVPNLSNTSDTTIYLCYGNAAISTDQQTASATWDTHYMGVWHMPDGTSLDMSDSTSHANNGSSSGATVARGIVDGAAFLNGSTDISVGQTTSLQSPTTAVTVEGWVNPSDTTPFVVSPIAAQAYSNPNGNPFWSYYIADNDPGCAANTFTAAWAIGSTLHILCATYPWHTGTWYHVAFTFDGTNGTLYVNGVQQATAAFAGTLVYSNGTFDIGNLLRGAIDEVRVSDTNRSAAWLQTEYNNQLDPGSFYIVGPITNSSNITNVSVGTTATQAVITFNTTSATPSACSVTASEGAYVGAPVHDVDASLFTGANLATRSDTLVNGHTVTFTIGQRVAAYATTGDTSVAYSRALQQDTGHAYEIACNSGADAYDGTFHTSVLNVGNTHEDSIPADPSVPGRPMWPTLESTIKCVGYSGPCPRRDATVIDPQEGTLVKPLVMPEDKILDDHSATHGFWMALDPTSTWTVNSGFVGGTATATVTGSSNKLAIIGMDDAESFTQTNSGTFGMPQVRVPAMLQFLYQASISNAACDGSNTSDDCKLELCLTLDGFECAANAQTYERVVSNSLTSYTEGSGAVYDVLQKPGKRIWSHMEIAPHYPTPSCAGANITIPFTGVADPMALGISFGVGSWAVFDDGAHQVASITDALHFTFSSAPSGCTFLHASNFGLLVWKKTTTGDTLTLNTPTLREFNSFDTVPQINSGYIGAPIQVTLANGDPGGIIRTNEAMYSVDLKTGHTETFSSVNVNNSLGSGLNNPMDSDGNIWFLGSDKSLSKAVYTGDYKQPLNVTGNGAQTRVPLWAANMDVWLNSCGSGVTTQCFTTTQVTQGGAPLPTLLNQFDSRYHVVNQGLVNVTMPSPGGTVVSVASTTGISVGMFVFGTNTPEANLIIAVNTGGSTITLLQGTGPCGGTNQPACAQSWFYTDNPFQDYLFNGIEGSVLNIDARWGGSPGQSYTGWHFIFDPNATCNINGTLDGNGNCVPGTYGGGCIGSVGAPAPGCIVAARRTWEGFHWTLDKGSQPVLKDGWAIDQSPESLGGGTGGGGPFVTDEVGTFSTVACPAGFTSYPCIQLTTDGDPYDQGDGVLTRGIYGSVAVGDYGALGTNMTDNPFALGLGSFPLLEVAQVSSNTLTLACINASICPTNNSANQQLYFFTNYPGSYPPWSNNGFGFGAFIWWDWKDDPHGTNSTGNTIITEYSAVQGHGFSIAGVASQATVNNSLQPRCPDGNCYNNRNYQQMSTSEMVAAMSDKAGNRQSGVVAYSTVFDGLKAFNGAGGSNNIQLHPDFESLNNGNGAPGLILDGRPWMGIDGAPFTSQLTKVGTSVYKVAASFSNTLHLRVWDMQGYAGSHILRNITAPGSSVTDGAGGYYTMCFALRAGECWAGSLTGEIYVNMPYYLGGLSVSSDSACYAPGGEATGLSDLFLGDDLCIFDAGVQNSHTRFNLVGFDSLGALQQSLGHGFLGGRADIFHSIHPATAIENNPYPNWYWWNMENWDTQFGTMLMKGPRFAPDSVSTERPFFAPVSVQINVPAGANGAGVEVGYSEYGGYCSPNRAEACVAVSATVNAGTPWYWENTENDGTYTPLACTHGTVCTIQAPVLWGHVARLTPVYYSGTTIVGRGPTQVIPVQ